MTPPYNGWYETYEFKFDDQLIKADNLNNNLSSPWMIGRIFAGFEENQLRLGDGFAIIYAIAWRFIAVEGKEGGSTL